MKISELDEEQYNNAVDHILSSLEEIVVPYGRMAMGDLAARKRTDPASVAFELDSGQVIRFEPCEEGLCFLYGSDRSVVPAVGFDAEEQKFTGPDGKSIVVHVLECYLKARKQFEPALKAS